MPFGIIGSFLIFTILRKEYNYRCAIGYKYYDDDVKWDKSTLWFPFYGFISGIFAGLLG
jgi:hypothetical protein